MTIDWDLQVVVPLWQGGGEPDVACGATRLDEMVQRSAPRRVVVAAPSKTYPGVRPVDLGSTTVEDLDAVAGHLDAASALIRANAPRRLLTLGGDCTVDVPSIAHLASVHPQLRVAWIDAHGDLNTPGSSRSRHAHGMPLRALLGDGHHRLVPDSTVLPERCALLGTRSLDPAEQDYIDAHRLPVLAPDQLHHVPDLLDRWLPPGAPLHIHLDLDVLDPAVWPAVAVPEHGGLDVASVVALLGTLRSRGDVVGVTIAEYAPTTEHDPTGLLPVLQALGISTVRSLEPRNAASLEPRS